MQWEYVSNATQPVTSVKEIWTTASNAILLSTENSKEVTVYVSPTTSKQEHFAL